MDVMFHTMISVRGIKSGPDLLGVTLILASSHAHYDNMIYWYRRSSVNCPAASVR